MSKQQDPASLGRRERWIAAFEVFALYLISGTTGQVVNIALPMLQTRFQAPLMAVTAISSAFSLGRLSTVLLMGWLTEKIGPKWVMLGGLCLIAAFFCGVAATTSVTVAIVFGVLGGIGMGTQDAVGPTILVKVFPKTYASYLGIAQSFFAAGTFLPALFMSAILGMNCPFYVTYYILAALCLPLLAVLPFMKWSRDPAGAQSAAPAEHTAQAGSRRRLFPWLMLLVMLLFYNSSVPTLYTTTYAMSRGLSEERAMLILTLANLGSMVGAIFFSALLRKHRTADVILINFAGALAAILLARVSSGFVALSALYFLINAFQNIVFNMNVTLAVEINPSKASSAGAIVAMVGGATGVLLPLVTGAIATNAGVGATLSFAAVMAAGAVVMGLVYRRLFYTGETALGKK